MDFRNVKSLSIGGKPVAKLLIGGRLVWKKAEPAPPEPVVDGAYIETDGVASYMDLGLVPGTGTSYEIDCMYVSGRYSGTSVLRNSLYGASTGTTTTLANFVAYVRPSLGHVGFAKPTSASAFTEFVPGRRSVVRLSGTSLSVDDHVETVTNNYAAATSMKLGCSYPGSADFYSVTRFYAAKFWQDGVLIRDLVPYSGPRGVGLLDMVNDVLYTNAGGGSLTYGVEGGDKEAYVHTKGLSDSFWSVPATEFGCIVPPPESCQFGIEADIMIDDDYLPDGQSFAAFGFALTNSLSPYNLRSYAVSRVTAVRAYRLGSIVTAAAPSLVIPTGERHVVNWDVDPVDKGLSSVSLDGTVGFTNTSQTAKYPVAPTSNWAANITFGGIANQDGSVVSPGRMRVYRLKVWQFGNLLADLVPYKDGGVVGMLDAVSGRKFPGSNLEYGEE